MSATYPKPETPLPWHYGKTLVTADCDYVVHAANAFPHLVAALEIVAGKRQCLDNLMSNADVVERALAIARGEVQT